MKEFEIKRTLKHIIATQVGGNKIKIGETVSVVEKPFFDEADKDRKELRFVLDAINKHVLPGEVDSAEAIKLIIMDRDLLKNSLERAMKNIEALTKDIVLEYQRAESFSSAIDALKKWVPESDLPKANTDMFSALTKKLEELKGAP